MKIIDTHSHFNLHQFDNDRDEAILRMEAAGVGTICVGIDEETSKMAVDLATKHKSMWACVGQHPTEWCKDFDKNTFLELAKKENVVVIGECGLDYYRERELEQIEKQKSLFTKQIELAIETNLPLMLHIRPEPKPLGLASGLITRHSESVGGAYEDALEILESYKDVWPTMRGTAHFFVGTKEIADRFLRLGFHISFSGVITFVREFEDLVAHVPIDRILPETDAPFAVPIPYRGKRNEPAYVTEVVKKIGEIKGLSFGETARQLLENAKELFNI